MKYVEQIKSIALFLLIFLSLALTFTIWTFTPSLATIETTPAIDTDLGETKTIEQVVQPLKVLYQYADKATGTVDRDQIDLFLNSMRQWKINELALLESEASPEKMKSLMHEPNRAVLYYPGTVPFPVFDTVMDISDSAVPEASFDRIVVEWGDLENNNSSIYFINSISGRVYQGQLQSMEIESFRDNIIEQAANYPVYITEETIGVLPIYVPEGPVDETSYTYLYEEIAVDRFAEGLFRGNNVEPTGNLLNGDYTDDTGALLSSQQGSESINYVQPKAETPDPAIPSELLFNTFSFINDHGGWTNDYHYFGMEPIGQHINYRLFLNNLPVFSLPNLSTELEVEWGTSDGIEQVFRYKRPIYILESTGQTNAEEQASGKTVLAVFNRLKDEEKEAITEIIPSYELSRNSNEPDQLMVMKPAWHFKINGTWMKLSKEALGGGPFGLE